MPSTPDQISLDTWTAIIGATLAGLTALAVPITAFMKTWFEYRIEAKKAEALKPEAAREIAATAGTAVFDSMAISDLTSAVKDLTAAIRADTASDEAHHSSEIASLVERFTNAMNQWEEDQENRRRYGRRPRDHHPR